MAGVPFVPSPELREEIAARVSVVAVNHDGLEVLEPFVASVWASDAPPLELLVVDNGSTDGSQDWVRARPDATLVVSSGNLGFGGGCDEGARHARGDLLLFANPDVVFAPDMLGALVGNLRAHPEVAVSFPKMVEGDEEHVREPQLEDVATMAGAVMLVRRDHFERLGGFDERMFLYHEDTDFCWRTRLAGRRVTHDWQAVAQHDPHGTGGGPRWSAEQIENGLLAHLKARPPRAIAAFAARMAVKTVVRGLRFRDPAVLGAWVVTARRMRPVLAERRALLGASSPALRAELERLCAESDHWRRVSYRAGLRRAVRARLPGG
jgi:GT2 family glycosyltransferase